MSKSLERRLDQEARPVVLVLREAWAAKHPHLPMQIGRAPAHDRIDFIDEHNHTWLSGKEIWVDGISITRAIELIEERLGI